MSAAEALSIPENDTTVVDIDAQLDAVWDKNNAVLDALDKGEKNPQPDEQEAESAEDAPAVEEAVEGESAEGAETEGEGAEAEESASETPDVPLPTNWQGLDETWAKLDPDTRAKLAEREAEVHRRMSDQGRQIASFKPVQQTIEKYQSLLEGRTKQDGSPVTPQDAVSFLFDAQAKLDNPQTRLSALMGIIDSYGAREHIAGVLSGKVRVPQPTQQQPQGLTPQQVEKMLEQKLSEDRTIREIETEVGRLSQDKPLYSSIPEETMVQFINLAWSKLGEGASRQDVFNTAYDMAVHADPDLRAKATAPKAVATRKISPEAARRANSVNVTSTSSSQSPKPNLDDKLDAIWDKYQRT